MREHEEERKFIAEKQRLKAAFDLKKYKRDCADEEERYEEKKEQQMRGPYDALAARIDSTTKEMNHKFDRMMDAMNRGNDKGDDKSLMMIMKSMELSQQASQKSMENVMSVLSTALKPVPPPQNDNIEVFKLITETNRASQEALAKAKDGEQSVMLELMKATVMKTLSSPDDGNKKMLDMLERGISIANMVHENNNPGPTEEVFDREGGFFSNMGNLILHGAKTALEGLASGGGRGAASALVDTLRNPGALVTPTIPAAPALPAPVAPVAPVQQPLAAPPVQAAPVPQVQPVPQQPSPNVIPLNARFFDAVIDDGADEPQPPVQAAPVQAPSVQTAPTQEVPAQVDEDEHVSEAMRQAIEDLDAQRQDPDWCDYAGRKWGRFVGTLSSAPDDSTRLQMISRVCDPEIWQALALRLKDGAGVNLFLTGLRSVIAEYNGAISGAA
jgi:hypothetical protein